MGHLTCPFSQGPLRQMAGQNHPGIIFLKPHLNFPFLVEIGRLYQTPFASLSHDNTGLGKWMCPFGTDVYARVCFPFIPPTPGMTSFVFIARLISFSPALPCWERHLQQSLTHRFFPPPPAFPDLANKNKGHQIELQFQINSHIACDTLRLKIVR